MSKQAAAVAWLAFKTELDEATQIIQDRFDAMLAEGFLPGREKHKPGGVDHDQSRHGRRGGAGPSARVERGIIYHKGVKFEAIASYGNTASANNRVEREGGEANAVMRIRHEGRYWVVKVAEVDPEVPTEPPTPTGKAGAYSRTGLPTPTYADNKRMVGITKGVTPLTDKEKQAIRPNQTLIETTPGNYRGNGTPLQKKQTSQIMAQLPLEHQLMVNSVTVNKGSDLREVGESQGVVGTQQNGHIHIAGGRGYTARSKTVAHEVGHSVLAVKPSPPGATLDFRGRRRDTYKAMSRLWRDRADKAGIQPVKTGRYLTYEQARKMIGVTSYSKGSPGEFMAESYGYYVTQPSLLKRRDPQAYAILKDELFQGQEYPDLSAK